MSHHPTVPVKLASFLAALVALFGVGAAAGAILGVDPPGRDADAARGAHGGTMDAMPAADPVRGLGIAEHGLRLALDPPELEPGRPAGLRFRILDQDERVVRAFDVEHTKRMHLIVVRRDA